LKSDDSKSNFRLYPNNIQFNLESELLTAKRNSEKKIDWASKANYP
jgi:uncharacterized protein YegP (UPF0339 family)